MRGPSGDLAGAEVTSPFTPLRSTPLRFDVPRSNPLRSIGLLVGVSSGSCGLVAGGTNCGFPVGEAFCARRRSNGPPVAAIHNAATVKAPMITHLRRLTAPSTAGETLSSSWGTSTGEPGAASSAEGGRSVGLTSSGFVDLGSAYRGAAHRGHASEPDSQLQSHGRQMASSPTRD